MRAWGVLLVLVSAGCLAPSADVDPAAVDVWPGVRAALGELPCEAPVGAGTSANLAELARLPVSEGSHGELALFGSWAAVARYQTGGFDLVDVSDPLSPRVVSSWDPEVVDRSLDVKFSPDGATLLVGGDLAISLVDVRVPASPRVESVYELATKQAHMLTVFEVEARSFVASAKGEGYDLAIYEIVGEPGARSLSLVASPRLTLLGEPSKQDILRSHDAWFHVDELSGLPLLWVANSWDGIVALDVSDPEAPVVAARIPNADPFQAYTHTVQTSALDGRRLVVSVHEVGANVMKVYDATDLAAPKLVALWSVPAAAKPQHNLQVVGSLAFVAHYDEGVFVFDLADVGAGPVPTRLAPIAHLASVEGESASVPSPATAFGGTWDVIVADGLLYTSEIAHGMRVAGFGCVEPGDASVSSTG